MRTSLSEVVYSPTLEAPALFPIEVATSLSNIVFSITPDQALMTECGNEEVGHGPLNASEFSSNTTVL